MSFKKYRSEKKLVVAPIVETTVPDHLQYHSDMWDHHSNLSSETHDKLDAAMGPGKSFTSFPLNNHNHDVDADVADHLTKHNYQVKDYVKGIATIKKTVGDPSRGIPMREKHVEEKIGSVLEKTGASDDIKKTYMNDPARSASKGVTVGGGHHVVITHGALGVSGMSTGTSWRNQSCMNQEGGVYSHKLKDDSENGTHVAYLVHHDDVNGMKHGEPDNPIARIAIKPYHEEEDDHHSDTIFRPETKTYGSGNTSFENAVSHWSGKHYPAKAGVEYTKNNHVYDDTGNNTYKSLSKEEVEHSIDHGSNIVSRTGNGMDKEMIDHAINHGKKLLEAPVSDNVSGYAKKNFIRNMADIGNLNTQHVATLHNMAGEDHSDLRSVAVNHGDKMSSNAINKSIETFGAENTPNKMLMNPKLPANIVDSLSPDKYSSVRRSLLKPHHYDKVVDSYLSSKSGSGDYLRQHQDHFTKEHIDKLTNIPSKDAASGLANSAARPIGIIMNSKHFSQEHHDTLVSGLEQTGSTGQKHNLLGSSKFSTLGDVDKLGVGDASTLAKNPHISSDTAIKVKDRFVGNASLGASKEHGGLHDIKGFSRGEIPESISKHMTQDDHSKLAESGKSIYFQNANHSEKHLKSIYSLVHHADADLGNHIDKMTKHHEDNDLDEYDHTDGEDDHATHLVDKLHSHIENYARSIDSHIDQHVSGSQDEYIKDTTQHVNVQNHLDNIDKLDNYKTRNNSHSRPYSNETDHFDDHVGDIHDRMDTLHKNDEHHEIGHDWD